MAKKTISNSFTVNTLVDGESVFDASLDHNVIGVECDTEGNISETVSFLVTISAHYGSENVVGVCAITDNHEDVDSDISVEYAPSPDHTSEPWVAKITFTQGNALASMLNIAFTITHPTYGTRVVALAINRVVLGKDGTNAPFYNEEWYAWSNDTSTASVTTEPTISGSWSHSIPSQGSFAYLWKKIIRYDYNTSTKQYVASNAQYFRMSGTNGTSIHTRGQVANASSRGSGTATIITDSGTQTITLSDGDAVTQLDNGHLYQWVTEGGGRWLDLGQFKGENGVTYYTHIAWATSVELSQSPLPIPAGQQNTPNATSVSGFVIVPSGADLPWMGYLIDTNASDSTTYLNYTWSETKGAKGDDSIAYEIQSSIGSIKIPSNQTTTSKTITFKFYSKTGNAEKQAFRTYYTIYKRANNGVYTKVSPESATRASEATVTINNISVAYNAIVVYIWGEDYTSYYDGMRPETQAPKPYLTKLEIPIIKDGDNGQAGERGKVGRFYYYSGFDWDATNNTDTFVVNDAQVPYFSKAGGNANGYYVFNREETPSGGEMTMAQMAAETTVEGVIQWNEAPWEVMTNDFKYLITKAIFGDYAEFGSFIINGVWLFSKWGQWLGNTVINGKVNYYNFNNGSISYISNSPIYAYVNSSDPSQSTISIHNDTTPRTGDTIYYPYTEGVYLALSRGTMYYLRLRCVRCKVYLCYENYEVELQQFPTAQQEGGLVIDSLDSYYIGSWLFQVQQSGNYLIKVVRDDSSESYKPSNTVAWLEVSAKYFRPNFAVNGENGKTAVKDMSADGAFSGSGNFTHAYSQGYSVGNYLSVGQSTKFDISSSGGNSKKYIYVDENGYLRVSTSERPIGGF